MKRTLFAIMALVCGVGMVRGDVEILWGVTGVAGAPSNLYVINPATGAILRDVGPTGVVNLTGLELEAWTGALLAAQGQMSPESTDVKSLFRLDKFTGAASLVGAMGTQYAISDLARRGDGAIFGFAISGLVKKLVRIDPNTAAVTEIGALNNITNVSLTFGANGVLYLVRTNGLFTVNPATGVMSPVVVQLVGATTSIDNFMATNSAGVIYAGLRNGRVAPTNLYTLTNINAANATTTLVGTLPTLALSGMVFDTAAARP